MSIMDADNDVTKLSLSELLVHIQRCERLLRHPTLLASLPDGGKSIRGRYALYIAEQSRRGVGGDGLPSRERNSSDKDEEEPVQRAEVPTYNHMTLRVEEVSERTAQVRAPTCLSSKANEGGMEREGKEAPESYEEAARAIGEKHRHNRVQVEAIVRQTFGGSLCEAEIQRMLRDVPPNFFLTHDETISMQQKQFYEERQDALKRLQRQRDADMREE